MTLCEIATGSSYSIPMECRAFSVPTTVSSRISSFTRAGGVKASHCVEWVLYYFYDTSSTLGLMDGYRAPATMQCSLAERAILV